MLRGSLVDEAALHGVLNKVRDLALPLLAVNRVVHNRQDSSSPQPPLDLTDGLPQMVDG